MHAGLALCRGLCRAQRLGTVAVLGRSGRYKNISIPVINCVRGKKA